MCSPWQLNGQGDIPKKAVSKLALAWSRAVLKAHQPPQVASKQPDTDISEMQKTLVNIALLQASKWDELLKCMEAPKSDDTYLERFRTLGLGASLVVPKLDGPSEAMS